MSKLALDLSFIVLVLATCATWAIGESGASGASVMGAVLGIAVLKSQLVIDVFMGLRRVQFRWKAPVLVWLALVTAFIALTYWKGMA